VDIVPNLLSKVAKDVIVPLLKVALYEIGQEAVEFNT
jgi:hypothetical protein